MANADQNQKKSAAPGSLDANEQLSAKSSKHIDEKVHASDIEAVVNGARIPAGDRGERGKTWTPPDGEQGISNREDDERGSGPDREE
jgi:hypothetical protein